MTPAARLSAAIELIETIDTQRIPAAKALKEWGTAHRYAGSGDRAAISGLIWDVLRRRASSAWIMDDDTPRARVLGHAQARARHGCRCHRGALRRRPFRAGAVERGASAPRSTSRSLDDAPAPYRRRLSGMARRIPRGGVRRDRVAEATAMASRAPLDLRVNTLKAKREKVLASTAHLGQCRRHGRRSACASSFPPTPAIPASMPRRISSRALVEVQDEGSQLAALLSAAKPGEQVIDLCAGAGGKTLALAAMMQGKGRLIATDHDKRQLAPIYERLSRAGVHNCDVRTPKGAERYFERHPRLRRSGADRRALHGNRHLAAQPGRQMADAARRARGAAEGPDRGARSRRAPWSNRAGGSPTSPARCCRRKTATRSAAFSPAIRILPWCRRRRP